MRLENEVVVITGGTAGIGFETARLACAEGAHVAIVGREHDDVERAVKRLGVGDGRARGFVGDVTNHDDVRRNTAEIIDSFGRITVLVNNAGHEVKSPAEEISEEHWRHEIDVNLTGPFFWAQAVATASMIPNRRGAIINVGSGGSLAAIPTSASYVAAKHGLIGLTKALAVDWGQYGVRVNCVCPGLTWTDLAKSVAEKDPEAMKAKEASIPIGRGAQPSEPAKAILFLASSDAEGITGATLAVDGGATALESGYAPPRNK